MELKRTALTRYIALVAVALGPDMHSVHADTPDQSELRVKPDRPDADTLVGDGRSFVPIVISGGPPAREGELAEAPEQPTLSCDNAATLPPRKDTPPAVLIPAVSEATTLACRARMRDAETAFELALQRPPDGLYASVAPPQAKAMGEPLALRVFSLSADGPTAPSALRASVSTGTLSVQGPGALLINPPRNRAPRVIAVAMTDGEHFGAAFVPITGTAVLPVDTTRRADVSVRVAGRWFGPVRARKKRVEVPIEVPPGVTQGVARATDRRGNSKETLVDLRTPDAVRLAVVAPIEEMQRNQQTQLAIAVATARGQPAGADAQVVATASRGRVGPPRPLADGLWLADYQAPDTAGEDEVTIRVEGDESAGTAVLPLRVLPPPKVEPPPPAPSWLLGARPLRIGAHAGVGWLDNRGDVSQPRFRIGVQADTDIGPANIGLEIGVQWLVEFTSLSDTDTLMMGADPFEIQRSVRVRALPLQVRAHIPVWGPMGASLAVALVPMHTSVTLTSEFQPATEYSAWVFGQRANLAMDVQLPLGRLSLAFGVGRAPLPEGPLTGNLERLTVTAGYDVHFVSL